MCIGSSLLFIGILLFLKGSSFTSIPTIFIGFMLFSAMLKWKDITWKDLQRKNQNIFISKHSYRNNKVIRFIILMIAGARFH
jgi:hypothetical protein